MRVFVTGGTGAVGSHAVPALVQAGHTVTALARTPAKAVRLREQGARPVTASMFDVPALTAAFAGQDAVINLASAMPSMARFPVLSAWAETERVRTEGSAAVVDAALAAGVSRLVQESVSMVYPDRGSQWIAEDTPPQSYPQARGNLAAEANVRRFTDAGGMGVVLRFGLFYGPGAAHSEQMLEMARRHLGTLIGPPGSFLPSIHVADAGTAAVAALHAPAGTFNVVDDEPLTKRAYALALERAAGKAAWLPGPGRAALLLGHRLASLTRSLRVSNTRFREATGWRPRYPSAREGWAATAAAIPAQAGKRSFTNRALNPMTLAMVDRGLAPPTYAIVETTGRKTGRTRWVPVANGLDGDTFWLIAGLGERASFVRNIRADPRVRVRARPARLRDGVRMRWRTGTAHPLPEDDAAARHEGLGRGRPGYRLDGAILRGLAAGGKMLTVRIDLD